MELNTLHEKVKRATQISRRLQQNVCSSNSEKWNIKQALRQEKFRNKTRVACCCLQVKWPAGVGLPVAYGRAALLLMMMITLTALLFGVMPRATRLKRRNSDWIPGRDNWIQESFRGLSAVSGSLTVSNQRVWEFCVVVSWLNNSDVSLRQICMYVCVCIYIYMPARTLGS